MNTEKTIDAASMIGMVFRKRDSKREERIKFVTSTEFWHRYVEQEDSTWNKNTYRMRDDGSFELDWGRGDVFLCQFLQSSNQFIEMNSKTIFYWELHFDDDYFDGGSGES